MTAQTIHEAATTTGWSPRMLRYIEQLGLVRPPRSAGGYRLYGQPQLQRLRTLRGLIARHGVELGDIGFALRLRNDPALAADLDSWFAAAPAGRPPVTPAGRPELHGLEPDGPADWLRFEQDKHQQLLQQ